MSGPVSPPKFADEHERRSSRRVRNPGDPNGPFAACPLSSVQPTGSLDPRRESATWLKAAGPWP
jgi:hypothetical protein